MIFKFLQILSCMAATILFLSGCTDSSLSKTNLQTKNESSSLGDEASSAPTNDADLSNMQQMNVSQPDTNSDTEEDMVKKMTLQIGNSSFTATLENNPAVDAFVEMMSDSPITIQMNDYSGFEKVGSLGTSLSADDKQTTTHAGILFYIMGSRLLSFMALIHGVIQGLER